LTNLRNQLTIKHNESPISSQDERLLLVQQWLGDGRRLQDIFDIWEKTDSVCEYKGGLDDAYLIHTQKHGSLNALIISLLSAILSLISVHHTYHAVGHLTIKTLLTPTFMRRLNSYIGGSNKELILVSLKLYNSLSTFAGGRERKAILDAFPWELKVPISVSPSAHD
jgi:nucleolar pre-ribosomal-associated protein 1